MNTHFYFKKQLDSGAREMFFYGIEYPAETVEEIKIVIKSHKRSLDTFPTNLEFLRMLSESSPLFKEVNNV